MLRVSKLADTYRSLCSENLMITNHISLGFLNPIMPPISVINFSRNHFCCCCCCSLLKSSYPLLIGPVDHRGNSNNLSSLSQCRVLAPASEFLKKGCLGKYFLVCTCPNGQADFLSTTHFSYKEMAQISRNMLTMQQNFKRKVLKIIKSMRNNTCHSSICYNLLRESQTLCRAS